MELTTEQLTKREYIAALMLQSIVKNGTWIEFSQYAEERGIVTESSMKIAEENSKRLAAICVQYADALLAQLNDK